MEKVTVPDMNTEVVGADTLSSGRCSIWIDIPLETMFSLSAISRFHEDIVVRVAGVVAHGQTPG